MALHCFPCSFFIHSRIALSPWPLLWSLDLGALLGGEDLHDADVGACESAAGIGRQPVQLAHLGAGQLQHRRKVLRHMRFHGIDVSDVGVGAGLVQEVEERVRRRSRRRARTDVLGREHDKARSGDDHRANDEQRLTHGILLGTRPPRAALGTM